jgi:cobalamin biosynthesis protein CobD/CbiB
MAAMAGLLGVTLDKPGHYRLGDGDPPTVATLAATRRVVAVSAAIASALVVLSLGVRHACLP